MGPAKQLTVLLTAALGLVSACAPQEQVVSLSAISPDGVALPGTMPAAASVDPANVSPGTLVSQDVYCVMAPEGQLIAQEKWNPYATPCPPGAVLASTLSLRGRQLPSEHSGSSTPVNNPQPNPRPVPREPVAVSTYAGANAASSAISTPEVALTAHADAKGATSSIAGFNKSLSAFAGPKGTSSSVATDEGTAGFDDDGTPYAN